MGRCIKCKNKAATAGLCLSFYLLKRPQAVPPIAGKPKEKQPKGKLPTMPFCSNCFISFAKKRGADTATLEFIRRNLSPGRVYSTSGS